MKNVLFGITILAALLYLNPAFAKARDVTVMSPPPVTALINDWSQFRAGILAKTSKYNKYDAIRPSQLPSLASSLIGKWKMENRHDDSGYRLHAVLELAPDRHFIYTYQVKTGSSLQHWRYSGRWQLKNQILVLLIDNSNYPGEAKGDVLFWRLLQIGHSKLVYVRSGADELQAMTRSERSRGS